MIVKTAVKLIALTTDGRRLTANRAAHLHKPGDRYIDPVTKKWLQLHICKTMRHHFEFMRNQEPVYAVEGWEEF